VVFRVRVYYGGGFERGRRVWTAGKHGVHEP